MTEGKCYDYDGKEGEERTEEMLFNSFINTFLVCIMMAEYVFTSARLRT